MPTSCENVRTSEYIDSVKKEFHRLRDMKEAGHIIDPVGNGAVIEEAMQMLHGIILGSSNKVNPLRKYKNITKYAKSRYPGGIEFLGKGSKNLGDKAIEAVFERDGDVIVVTSQKWQFRFPNGETTSVATNNGDKARFKELEEIRRWMPREEVVYGSKESSKDKEEGYKKVEENPHGNPEQMVTFMDKLQELDGGKTSEDHMKKLRELIGGLNPEFFTKMSTFIAENAEENHGTVAGRKVKIAVSSLPKMAFNEMGAAEVYAHEVIHAMTVFAVAEAQKGDAEARALVRQLEYIMEDAQKRLTWKSFMPKNDDSINSKEEEKNAREMYKYLFNSKTGLEEFIAHALTNPMLMKHLQGFNVHKTAETKTMLEKIGEFFAKLVDIVMGRYKFSTENETAYQRVYELAMDLGAINNRQKQKIDLKNSITDNIGELIDNGNKTIQNAIDEVIKKFGNDDTTLENLKEGASRTEKIAWHGKHLMKIMRNKIYRDHFGYVLTAWGVTPEGVLRDWARAMTESSDLQKAAQWLGTMSNDIDRIRNTVISATKQELLDRFKHGISEEEETAITRALLDTDVQSLITSKMYTLTKVKELIENPEKLEKEIQHIKGNIKKLDKNRYNWLTNQAVGLGYYMATNKANIAQNLNAHNIVMGFMSNNITSLKGKTQLVEHVDALATLAALKYTKESHKTVVAQLLSKEYSSVEYLLKTHAGFVKESNEKLFQYDKAHMIKGYTKEHFDDKITMEIAPLDNQTEMENRGFTLKAKLGKVEGDSNAEMGLYISEAFITNEWHRSAVRLTGFNTKGTEISAVHYRHDQDSFAKERAELDKLRIDKKRKKIIVDMEKGTYDPTTAEGFGLAPVLDQYGRVKDYRYMMSKDLKESVLGQDTVATSILAKSFGSIVDKTSSQEVNKKTLDLILSNMKDNWVAGKTVGKDGLEYVEIGPDSYDKQAKEIYKVLPKMFKDAIKEQSSKSIAVPREQMNLFFGYRQLSITDIPGLDVVTPRVFRTLLKIAETLWVELVKVYKGSILLKLPVVLISNIVSNFMYAITTLSLNPVELLKDYLESFRDIRKYISNEREATRLTVKVKSSTATASEKTRLELLKQQMSTSPIKELMDIGLYQAVIEDVETMNLGDTNKIKQQYEELANKYLPAYVKQGVDWMFLNSNTKWYKINQEVLQMSDLIARDVENRRRKKIEQMQASGAKRLPKWWTDKHGDTKLTASTKATFLKEAKEVRHIALLENYINYAMPNSRFEEYLNRVGAIMFTKYAKRIQKIITTSAYTNPIESILMLLGQTYLVDVETIQDQSLINRSWYNFGLGAGDSIPGNSPIDIMEHFVTPPIVTLSDSRSWI